MKNNPGIIFLGVCERASYVTEGNTNILKWNIIGLKHVILSNIYPLSLAGIILGIAFDNKTIQCATKITIFNQDEQEVGFINLELRHAEPSNAELALKKDGPMLLVPKHGWTTAFLPIGKSDILIASPGRYYLKVEINDTKEIIGEIQFALIDPPELTPERIAAIKSDPTAAKFIRIEVGCKKCPDKFKAYAGLEQNKKLEDDGHIFYSEIPDTFVCGCGGAKIDLTIIRKNLHGLLGQRRREESLEVGFIPLYEKSTLDDLRKKFVKVINSKPKEELLQKFIEENLILLHQFPAEKIFFKPPILTFFKADFGIITPQKELILIEIEKTTTKLLKNDGGVHHSLTHAFDQVRDWLHRVDEHRLAILDSLKIDRSQVSTVRGVVIAGLDSGYDAQYLRQLKGNDWGRVIFLTYDDLLFALDALRQKIDQL